LQTELTITIESPDMWIAIGLALVLGLGFWSFGTWIARTVGILERDAPHGESLGVGLAVGLLVIAAWWAAIWSGGRSSFTPVAVGFAIAIATSVVARGRHSHRTAGTSSTIIANGPLGAGRLGSIVLAGLAAGAFLLLVALVYGATLAPSPRDGVQPIEHPDAALYAVLGRQLAASGTEASILPSGFSEPPGLPVQTWYHWGELWLASAVIKIFATAPMAARYFIVLPMVLLAAAALTGTLVRRMTGSKSSHAYVFGFLACLFLAPLPLVAGPVLSAWAAGLLFGVTVYGLAAVGVLLGLYAVSVVRDKSPTWGLAAFVGSSAAFILPAHIVIAFLSVVGVAGATTVAILSNVVRSGRLPIAPSVWRRAYFVAGIATAATAAWAILTGHGLVASPPLSTVLPFNAIWHDTIGIMLVGAGTFLAIPVVWLLDRNQKPLRGHAYLGSMILVLVGAIVWGARFADFNMYYVFFGGIAVFATPLAAAATWSLLIRILRSRRPSFGLVVVALFVAQLACGSVIALSRLANYGPLAFGYTLPVPVDILAAIRELPSDAKVAYACHSQGEATFGEPALLGFDAHTGHPMVPMCFISDTVGIDRGSTSSPATPSVDWVSAPQRALYPDAAARPDPDAVVGFLKAHSIEYIYVDSVHPNRLAAGAAPVTVSGQAAILRIP
jgi:hypothetical protein